MITKVLNETGSTLLKLGYSDLGAFVLDNVNDDDTTNTSALPSACALIARLSNTLNAFRDGTQYQNTSVCFLNKATRLVVALYRRFHDEEPALNFNDMDTVLVGCDAVRKFVL